MPSVVTQSIIRSERYGVRSERYDRQQENLENQGFIVAGAMKGVATATALGRTFYLGS